MQVLGRAQRRLAPARLSMIINVGVTV